MIFVNDFCIQFNQQYVMIFDYLYVDDLWMDVCSKGFFSGLICMKLFVVVYLFIEFYVEVVDENYNV